MENNTYNDYSTWLRHHFTFKVQKISIDAGFSCPNRDGSISFGGCTFCNNSSFNPSYCNSTKSVRQQLEEGKKFFSRKYPDMKFIAYFQAYSNTYGPLEKLKKLYEEAFQVEDVVGIIIGTRPDCVTDDLLAYLAELSKHTFVMIEYGVESVYDSTLEHINRGHTFAQSQETIIKTHNAGIICGIHVILGLPGETNQMMLDSAKIISDLPIDIIKIHQLQIIKGTKMEQEQNLNVFTIDEYIKLLSDYIERLRPSLVLERFVSQSPPDMVIAPQWGLKNYEFTHKLVKFMQQNDSWQGKKYIPNK